MIKDQLVVITNRVEGDCGMFHVEAGTIAKIHEVLSCSIIKVVVTPHNKGFITLSTRSVRVLTCIELNVALPLFLEVPRFTLRVAKLY